MSRPHSSTGRPFAGDLRRRELLAAGGAAVLFAPAIARGAIPGGPETIIVIGAGLAGMTAALRLRETGRRVVVLEGRDVAGGRVRTIRDPFDNGLYGEAGAARISDVHHFVLHWLNRYNLKAVDFSPPDGRTLFVNGDVRAFSDDPGASARLVAGLRGDETGLLPADLANHYLEGLPENLRDAEVTPEMLAGWVDLDKTTWPLWLKERGASDAAVALLTLGADSSEISALYVLRQIFMHRAGRVYLKIEGGMDRLPRALADELGEDILYGARVTALEQTDDGVRVTFTERGETKTISGARALVAVPFTVLRDITVTPALSAEKSAIIGAMPYRSSLRFLLQTDRPYWRDHGLSGAARTDAPCEIWDASVGQLSVNGLISVTAGGRADMRERFARMDEAAQLRLGIEMAGEAFPDFAHHFQKGFTQNWTEDVWSKGAFAVSHPGQITGWGDKAARPEGRIHFAGEHVSPWPGWMEGALWSAERAVQELL